MYHSWHKEIGKNTAQWLCYIKYVGKYVTQHLYARQFIFSPMFWWESQHIVGAQLECVSWVHGKVHMMWVTFWGWGDNAKQWFSKWRHAHWNLVRRCLMFRVSCKDFTALLLKALESCGDLGSNALGYAFFQCSFSEYSWMPAFRDLSWFWKLFLTEMAHVLVTGIWWSSHGIDTIFSQAGASFEEGWGCRRTPPKEKEKKKKKKEKKEEKKKEGNYE